MWSRRSISSSRRRVGAAVAAGCVAAAIGPSAACARPVSPCGNPASRPWCDPALSADRRADLLVGAMTQDEKLGLLSGDDLLGALRATDDETQHVGTLKGVPRLGIPTIHFADGPVGVRQGAGTALPAPISLAAGFDPAAARRTGAMVGDEARLKGDDVVHGPAVDVLRNDRWGRSFETYGEDPFLSAGMAAPWVEGLQSQGVMANVKHFPIYNQETNRLTMENVVAPRVEREIYLPPFEAAVRNGRAATVMCAYNHTNGEDSCGNRVAIQQILRGEWGFPGFVLSDYVGAVRDGTAAVSHGLDLEMPVPQAYSPLLLRGLLAAGRIGQAAVDGHVRAMVRTLFAFGVFDRPPYTEDGSRIDYAAHAALTESLSENGITLLKNTGILPLRGSAAKSVAIIGWPADTYHSGGGSSDVRPRSVITPREGIARRAGKAAKVAYVDGSDLDAAASAARSADVALVFASDSRAEGADVGCLSLRCSNSGTPVPDPDRLIERVAAANPRTIVVLETGGPVLTPWAGKVKGIVEAWYPGEHGGAALARVLYGDTDPGGRLPVTFPKAEGDAPTAGDPARYPGTGGVRADYSEGVLTGYRHYDARHIAPAFPFGYGLSYTRFRFDDLAIRQGAGGSVKVSVTVTDTGSRPGVAVPQVYVGLPAPDAATPQPPRQLRGFAKIRLGPGGHGRVTFTLTPRELSYWNEGAKAWRIAPGCYHVTVGSSSRDAAAAGRFARGGASC